MDRVVGRPDERRYQRERDGDQGVEQTRPQDGHDDDGQQQGRDGEQGIEQVMEHARLHPFAHAAEDADGRADDQRDEHHQQGVAEGEPGPGHQTGEDVAPQIVGPQEVIDVAAVGPGGGEQQVVAVLIVDAVGDHQGTDEGHQQQQPEAPEPRHGQRVASVGGPGLLQGGEDLELRIDVRFIVHDAGSRAGRKGMGTPVRRWPMGRRGSSTDRNQSCLA